MSENLAIGLTALGLGVIHALEPGHGKTLMAGTLIGSKKKWMDPLVLACSTAVGHMVGMLLFTVLSFALVHNVASHELKIIIESLIGASILILGCWELLCLKRRNAKQIACCRCGPTHLGKAATSPRSTKYISGIGLLVGLVPCHSILVIAASTATLNSLTQAILMACVFAGGIALTLLIIGVILTHTSNHIQAMPRLQKISRVTRFIAPISLIALGLTLLIHTGTSHAH